MICDLCLNYGVQTVATTVQRKKVQVCFECMDKKQTETLLRQGPVVNATADEVRLRKGK